MSQFKNRLQTRVGKFFGVTVFAVAALLFAFASPNFAEAAVRTSTATGGLWSAGSTWVGGTAPANADSVIIATTGGNSVTIGANTTNAGLTVNPGAILNFSGAFTLTENGAVVDDGSITGSSGILKMNSAGKTIDGGGSMDCSILVTQNFSFAATANLTINNNINSPGKTVTNSGTVNLNGNYARTSGTAIWTQGTNSTLAISGAFTPAANVTLNASASGNTINYNGASQTPDAAAYNNLIFSGTGTVSVLTGLSVAGNLSIAPTGSAVASIGAGLNISVGTLTTGGLGTINGTWGSTGSAATYTDDNYFAVTTGILTVATDSRTAQATLTAIVTPSTLTYGSTSALSSSGGSGTGAVSFSVGASTGCSISGGTTLNLVDVGGTCSVTATKAADRHYLSATSATVPVTLSSGVTQFTLNSPGTLPAGQRAAYVVTRKNQSNNPVPVGTSTVYLYTAATSTGKFYNAASGGAQITSVQIINGASTASFWYEDTALGSHLVTASDNSTAPDGPAGIADGTDTITVTTGPVSQYILSGASSMYAKTRSGFTVSRKDAYGNYVTSGTSTVHLYNNSSSTNAKFYNDALVGNVITSIAIANGQSSASFWYYDDTAATVNVIASDNATSPDGAVGIQDSTVSITVLPVATKFVIIQPADGTVDAPITVTVQAQKPDGSVDTNYQSDVTLGLTGSATTTGTGLVDIINGVGTKNISDTAAETVTLSLSDTQSTGLDITSTKQVVFSAGVLSQFTLNHPGSIGAGTRAAYMVVRKDQYGNLISSGTSTVYLYTNSPSSQAKFYADAVSTSTPITAITIGPGSTSANFWYYDQALGSWTITVSDNATAPDGVTGVNDAMDSLTVVPGAVATFSLSHSATITVGTRAAYTVTRYDAFGNLVTSGSTNAYLYSSSVSTSSAFYLVSSGGSPTTLTSINDGSSNTNFWYTDGVVGTYTITVSDNATSPDGNTGIADGTDSLTVSPAPIVATRLVILDPGAATTDAAVTVTVQAQDNSGSVDTTFNGTVTLNTTGSATGGGAVTITNGVGTKAISDTLAQSIALSLTDTGGTGLDVSSSKTLTFSPGALAQFTISSPGDMAAGTRQALTVSRKDQFGNGVVSGLTTAYLYSASTNSNKRFYDSASGGSSITFVNFTAGVSSAQVWYYDETAATTTVTISDNATAPDGLTGTADGSAFVHVVAGPVAKFLLNNPGNMFAGTRLGYTASREDAYGNSVSSGITLVYLYSNSTGANKKFYDAASGGNVVTSMPIDDGRTSANFWYYDDQAGTWNVTASDGATSPNGSTGIIDSVDSVTVSLVPIVATRFVIIPPGGPYQTGTPVLVAIQAEDNSGNVQTDYNNSVTLNVSGSATGGGVVSIVNGIGVASVNDFTAETVDLSLTDSNSTGLDVSSVQSLTFSAQPVLQPGFTGGGTPSQPARVIIGGVTLAGVAFPGAKVSIVALGETATILKQATVASPLGRFQIDFRGISMGARTYGLLIQDKDGRVSQSSTFDVNLKNKSDILSVTNILVSPTIGFSRSTVTRGDRLIVVGYATPNSSVTFRVDGKAIIEQAQAGADGFYRVLLRTGELSLGSHTIAGFQQDSTGRMSDSSIQKVFNVTNLLVPQVDFNGDGKINVIDASIFLSRFNSTDPKVRLLNDLNGDGKVDTTDFSIFLRTLRLQ